MPFTWRLPLPDKAMIVYIIDMYQRLRDTYSCTIYKTDNFSQKICDSYCTNLKL